MLIATNLLSRFQSGDLILKGTEVLELVLDHGIAFQFA